MRRTSFFIACLLVSGCQVVDDPNNIPDRGHWQASTKLAALTIDDRSITAAEAPFPVPHDHDEDMRGFEPRLGTVHEINAIRTIAQSKCRVESLDRNGALITGHGKCQPVGKGSITITGNFGMSGEEASDRIKALTTSDMSAHLPDGQTLRVHSAHTLIWTRLGPC